MIDLCTLGTGGTMPLPDRALASLYVRVGGRAVLVDCGEGTQIGIQRLSWGIQCIDAILLTHYHAISLILSFLSFLLLPLFLS